MQSRSPCSSPARCVIDVLALAIEENGSSPMPATTLRLQPGQATSRWMLFGREASPSTKCPQGESRLMKTIGHGYYWNDLEVGFTFRTLNRTITESDLVGFINTTGMLEMIFIDQTFAHEGGIKGRVVPAALP